MTKCIVLRWHYLLIIGNNLYHAFAADSNLPESGDVLLLTTDVLLLTL